MYSRSSKINHIYFTYFECMNFLSLYELWMYKTFYWLYDQTSVPKNKNVSRQTGKQKELQQLIENFAIDELVRNLIEKGSTTICVQIVKQFGNLFALLIVVIEGAAENMLISFHHQNVAMFSNVLEATL